MPPKKRGRRDNGDDGGDDGGGGGGGDDSAGPSGRGGGATIGQQTSYIKNKQVRGEIYDKLRHKKAIAKKKARVKRQKDVAKALELGQEPPQRQIPKTIENTREKDETIVAADDEELAADVAEDEFAAHFNREQAPQIMVTTSRKPSAAMFKFLENLFETLPNATFYARRDYEVKRIVEYAKAGGYTDLLVFNENAKFSKGCKVNGLLAVHLPDGPTAHFRLSNLVLSKKIKGHGRATSHVPELILNNFTTRLGHRVGRMFASLFPQDPQFKGRRVVTLHNQRDFIFFRHHRYIFEQRTGRALPAHAGHLAGAAPPAPAAKGKKKKGAKAAAGEEGEAAPVAIQARLQELGPRFTLKILSLQKGTFDSKHGEYEWVRPAPGVAAGASRRRFYL